MSEVYPTPEQPGDDEERRQRRHRRPGIFWPLFLVTIGVLVLLNNLRVIPATDWAYILNLWPVLLIVGGLDGLWRGEGIAGSLFWLGVGVIFLLANLGYLPVTVWELLWRFWPVLLIAIGIDIIFGHRPTAWSQILSVVLALALLGGLVWFSVNRPLIAGTSIKSGPVLQELQGATSAYVELNMSAGQMLLSGGAKENMLLEGTVKLNKGEDVKTSYTVNNGRGNFTLREQGVITHVGGNENAYIWDFKLNDKVPTDLRFNFGAGQSKIDLNNLKVEGFNINTGAGQTIVTLPKEGKFNGSISGGVGELVLRVPKGLAVEVRIHRALTGLTVNGDFRRNGNTITSGSSPAITIDLNMPVGSVRIENIP